MSCANAARETAMGQFITQVQGAKAMLAVRRGNNAGWSQGKKLDDVANLLAGQVRLALQAPNDALEETEVKGRSVVKVLTRDNEWRRIDLRPPEEGDWELLDVARHPAGEKDQHAVTWASFAMMVLCAAQAESGWFDLVKLETRWRSGEGSRAGQRASRFHKAAHGIVLAAEAHAAIMKDLKRWLSLGFIAEPMLTVPVDGDYLTVKHRAVAGGRGPMGVKTDAKGTYHWDVSARIMAATPWTVATDTLLAIRGGGVLADCAERCEPNPVRRESILTGYSQLATRDFYMPIFMDFRGRVYTRPNLVTYQGSDLQKGLLAFPHRPDQGTFGGTEYDAMALHLGALYGGPQKLDKAPLMERAAWVAENQGRPPKDLLEGADEPIQLYTSLRLLQGGRWDDMLCQIDGTCNGLQHLSALFRDETAAPFVNLTESSFEERPSDVYAEVATRVLARLQARGDEPWVRRVMAAVRVDRKLTKKPVMVLPYGGTKVAIEDAVLDAILEQDPEGIWWTECLTPITGNADTLLYTDRRRQPCERDREAVEGNYLAFRERELKNHPLLHLDAKRLGTIVWNCIEEVLPRPMLAMQAFRDIAKTVGDRSLEWQVGSSLAGEASSSLGPLWVVQAKPKSMKSSLRFKGMHLPNSVRGLSLRVGADEVDRGSHTSGIVANFIHSQDASHLSATMRMFGQPCLGAIHDCLISRPSKMASLARSTRLAFVEQYSSSPMQPGSGHPLRNPVRLRNVTTGETEAFADWYALAEQCGVTFPNMGCWEPEEVLGSSWFFS
jgi:hypothetical protein